MWISKTISDERILEKINSFNQKFQLILGVYPLHRSYNIQVQVFIDHQRIPGNIHFLFENGKIVLEKFYPHDRYPDRGELKGFTGVILAGILSDFSDYPIEIPNCSPLAKAFIEKKLKGFQFAFSDQIRDLGMGGWEHWEASGRFCASMKTPAELIRRRYVSSPVFLHPNLLQLQTAHPEIHSFFELTRTIKAASQPLN